MKNIRVLLVVPLLCLPVYLSHFQEMRLSSADKTVISCYKESLNSENSDSPVFIANGSYPDIAADKNGVLHIVYARDTTLFYRSYNPKTNVLGNEVNTTLTYLNHESLGPNRSDPEIQIDHKGHIHVLVGQQYAYYNGVTWIKINPHATRDTDLALDTEGTVYITTRGGNNGGVIGIFIRKPGEASFHATEKDPDIGTPEGLNWLGRGHVYGSLCTDARNRIHVVYRQGKPQGIAYRQSSDGGKTWKGTGVCGGENPGTEAPDIGVTSSGKVVVVSPVGEVYFLDESSFQFVLTERAINCGKRDLPAISSGINNLMCISSFGGRYNIYNGSKFTGESILPSLSGKPIGFMETTFLNQQIWSVYEEGENVDNEILKGASAIYLKKLMDK